MKALALQPIKSGGDCFDDVIATLNGWFQQGCEMMYADALLFQFEEASAERETIASRMAMLNQPLHMLERFHGYSVQVHHCAPAQAWQIIQEELKAGHPIGLNIDSYYVPWDEKYRQVHYYMHMIVAVGYDEADNLICLDPYFEKTDQLLSREELELGFRACMTMRVGKGRIADKEELVSAFHPLLVRQRELHPPAFEALIGALDEMDFAQETAGCADFGGSRLYQQLSSLVFSRFNFAKTLDYMADTFELEPFRRYAEQCRQYSGKWTTVRALLAKMSYASQLPGAPDMTGNLKQRIRQLVEAEANLLDRLLAYLESGKAEPDTDNPMDTKAQAAQNSRKAEIVLPVQVAAYCNNRAIAAVNEHANFDAMGYYYARLAMPDGQLSVEDMLFAFPAGGNGEPDNIACEGQLIPLPMEEVRGIMLLGSGEQGDHSEVGRLSFADGTEEEVLVDFPDWWSKDAHSGHVIAWETNLAHAEKGQSSAFVRLFAKKIAFREPKIARELVLPNLPNLHVFGVSLWK